MDMECERFNSQDLEDYFNESICIETGKIDDDSQESDKAIDVDGESDFSWLRDIGITVEDGQEIGEDPNLFLGLNPRQASTVRKKIATANATLRKRRASKPRPPDVREVFSQHTSESSSIATRSRSATPNSLDSLSPCQTPPSPDWPSVTIQEPSTSPSSSASQGYHSSYRDDAHHPYVYPAIDKSRRRSLEPDLMTVFRPDDTRHPNSIPKDGLLYRYRGPKTYDFTQQFQDSDLGVEILGYQPMGSLSTPRGEPFRPPISESEITMNFSDDEPEDNKLDWGFEAVRNEKDADDDTVEFYEMPEKLGVTSICDLGAIDVKRVQTLALIELTTIFDTYKIRFSRRKDNKKRRKDDNNSLFGLPLTAIIENDRKIFPVCQVPLIVEKIISYLHLGIREEGLLRVPGSIAKIQILRAEIEENFYTAPERVDEALKSSCANDIAGLLKLFMRQLPVPILTNEYIEAFYRVGNIPDKMDRMKVLKLLILLLNDVHRNTLGVILDFLAKVAENEEHNRMTVQNIAMIVAPNLFIPRKVRGDTKRDLIAEMKIATITSKITKLMIIYRRIFWTVPSFMVRQIRESNEIVLRRTSKENNNKSKKWLLQRKQKTEIYRKINNEVDFQEGKIRVNAPQLSSRAVPVKLTDSMTCAEVVEYIVMQFGGKSVTPSKMQQLNGSYSAQSKRGPPLTLSMQGNAASPCPYAIGDVQIALNTHCLFEVGGNIGDRRLRHDAIVMGIYQQNPNAEWILRCCHL